MTLSYEQSIKPGLDSGSRLLHNHCVGVGGRHVLVLAQETQAELHLRPLRLSDRVAQLGLDCLEAFFMDRVEDFVAQRCEALGLERLK